MTSTRRRSHRWIPLATLVATVMLAAAACSSRASQHTIEKHLTVPSPPTTRSASGQALKATSPCPAAAKLPANTVDKGAANATGVTLHIDAGDTYFIPTCVLKVAPNTTVTLVVRNIGQMLHNVSVPDQGIDQDIAVGQTITVHIKVGTAPVVYFCKYHRTLGMIGSLASSA